MVTSKKKIPTQVPCTLYTYLKMIDVKDGSNMLMMVVTW
jgi:hypothetical protein